ncbi:MAG: hypothetical protein JWM64_2251, partial [Frankiales bacterium]|nr:hypothetical protein [Frankiales bacterium]
MTSASTLDRLDGSRLPEPRLPAGLLRAPRQPADPGHVAASLPGRTQPGAP